MSLSTRYKSVTHFAPTRWTVIVSAADHDSVLRRSAWETLAAQYWYPLYAWLRRQGHAPDVAEDLTQSFFARLIEKQDMKQIDPAKGRFRSFLLASLKHFISNERDKRLAQKRGGGINVISLSPGDSESRYRLEPIDQLTPDRLFDRQWALALLGRVLELLRDEYRQTGKEPLFDAIKESLAGKTDDGYAALGARVGISELAARVAAHRMHKRYRTLLRDEIAQTLTDPAMVDDELRDLMKSL